MEGEKQLSDGMLKTLFGDKSFDVKKIGNWIPTPNLVEEQKLNLCRKSSLQYYGLVHESVAPVQIKT